MAQKTAARGRPKGTGVDDAGALSAIAELMAANPGMKTTTAIKALGITNPSVVRRLRDKYQQQYSPRDANPSVNVNATAATGAQAPSNVIALRGRPAQIHRTPPAQATPRAPEPPPAEPAGEPASAAEDHPAGASAATAAPPSTAPAARPDLFAAAFAASVATANTAIHLHYKALWYAFHASPYACALRAFEFQRLLNLSLEEQAKAPRSSRPRD